MLGYLVDPQKQFIGRGGTPMAAGHVEVFLVGTDDHAVTYNNFEGVLNGAEIALDANGRAVIIADSSQAYRVEVYDDSGMLQWTVSPALVGGGSFVGLDGKADKVNDAVAGDVAGLDSEGNLTDTGISAENVYQLPSGGIPKNDLASGVKDSLDKADSSVQPDDIVKLVRVDAAQSFNDTEKAQGRSNIGAGTYSKPGSGIPYSDMSLTVQTSLSKADSAYQRPSNGIPSSDMTTQVQNALSLALTSLQGYEVDTYDNNPKSRHVLLFTTIASSSSSYASCIVKFVNIYGNGNSGSSVSVLVTLVARGTSDINVDVRVISNNNWDFSSNFPSVMYYVDSVNNTIEVRIALMEYDSDLDSFLATEMNYLRTNVIPLPKALNVTWNLTAHVNGGRTGQINVVAGVTGVYGTLPRVDVNLTSGTNNIYLDRNALYRLKCASGSSIINLLSHNATPLHCPIQILKNNQCEVLTLNWYNDAGYGESAQVSFDSSITKGYQGDTAYFDVNIWKDGANVIRRWMD